MNETIRYGFHDRTLHVLAPDRLSGINRGTILQDLVELASDCDGLVLDLSACTYMDSTFMGQLISLRKMLAPRQVVLSSPTPEARQILNIMGLHRIFRIDQVPVPSGMEIRELPVGTKASADTMLEAHELLSQVSPENARRFEQVLKALRESRG